MENSVLEAIYRSKPDDISTIIVINDRQPIYTHTHPPSNLSFRFTEKRKREEGKLANSGHGFGLILGEVERP